MNEFTERLSGCIARGKISRSAPFPREMKGQDGADEIAADALKNGIHPNLLLEACILGMDRIGKDFGEGKAYVTDLVVSAEAMKAVLKHIRPFLESGDVKRKGKFVIGTVSGDVHDIGKNLVAMTITGGGFEVIDLGVDVPTKKFVEAIARHPGCFVGLSALLTTTMHNMEDSVKAIKSTYPGTKVLIGGAPITRDFCTTIGADFYSRNPHDAVDYLNQSLV